MVPAGKNALPVTSHCFVAAKIVVLQDYFDSEDVCIVLSMQSLSGQETTVPNSKVDHTGLVEMEEYVCYGDRVCFLCEGQLLALTRKFNLTYQQMALLAGSTVVTGGLLGVAGFFVWRKELFRKHYAALFGDELYNEDNRAVTESNSESSPIDEDCLKRQDSQRKRLINKHSSSDGDLARHSVAFRFFEFDPEKQQLIFLSVGTPVRFDVPLVVVHAESGRAIRYLSHRGAATISKPPINLGFHRQVRGSLVIPKDLTMHQTFMKRTRPYSPTAARSTFDSSISTGDANSSTVTAKQDEEIQDGRVFTSNGRAKVVPTHGQIQVMITSPRGRKYSDVTGTSNRARNRLPLSPRSVQRNIRRCSLGTGSSIEAFRGARYTDNIVELRQPECSNNLPTETSTRPSTAAPSDYSRRNSRRTSIMSTSAFSESEPLLRSISKSCVNMISDISETLHQTRERHRDRRQLRRREKIVMKDLPNMSFNNSMGKYYVATVKPACLRIKGRCKLPAAPSDEFLRWGQPLSLVAMFNGRACGVRPRQYYKDSDMYLTTEATPTTIVPLREDGDLKCMAKESTRLLVHLEKRQVKLTVGTYNVWMLPRKVSAFTSCSPKKGTRARLIGDLLPPCDVWVLTECFDYRARGILLGKLSKAGYFFFSPTVGHKRMNKSNIRKLLNGGVILASKYPILSVKVKLFEGACAGGDKLADKGVLYCKILKDGLIVHVFSTHLQAWNDPRSRCMRKMQMEMVKKFMSGMNIDEVNDAVLFVGDLNVDYWLNKTNNEYDEMLEFFEMNDPSVVCPQQTSTVDTMDKQVPVAEFKHCRKYSFDPRVNALAANGLSSDGSLELLDYILYSRTHRQPQKATSWIYPLTTSTPWSWRSQLHYNLSDHFPVMSEFTFEM